MFEYTHLPVMSIKIGSPRSSSRLDTRIGLDACQGSAGEPSRLRSAARLIALTLPEDSTCASNG